MAELFAPENTLELEDTILWYHYVNDDENSADAKAVKPFMNCSQDWEQLRFLSGAAVGITVREHVCCSRIEASRCLHWVQVTLRDRDDGSTSYDRFGTQTKKRAVISSYRSEVVEDIRIGDEISSIMVMGKNCEYDGLDLIELLSEELGVEVKLRAQRFVVCCQSHFAFTSHSLLMIALCALCMAAAAPKYAQQ